MSYGLSDAGFTPKSAEVVQGEVEEDWRGGFEASADVDPQTPDGQIIAVLVTLASAFWDLLQGVNAAFDPDQAMGASLVALCALTGTRVRPSTPSTVTATLTGTPGTVVAAGKAASVAVTQARFTLDAGATISAVSAWTGTTVHTVGLRRYNGSPSRVYQVTAVTGDALSAGSGGPTGTGSSITDNHVTWRYLGDGTGAADAAATAEEDGPTVCNSGTLTVIENPVAGWQGVTNILDATLGRADETNEQLRERREVELRAIGNAAIDAIRADVEQVDGVTSCKVFENTASTTNADGLPPKSIEVLVEGGTDAAVAQAIWDSKAGGIETYGTSSATATDAAGDSHTVYFTRPTLLTVYAALTLLVDGSSGSLWPTDGDVQVQAAVAAFGAGFTIGRDVTASGVGAQAFKVPGVLDASPVYVGTAPAPASSATIAVGSRQRAVFDTSRVSVTVVTGTP